MHWRSAILCFLASSLLAPLAAAAEPAALTPARLDGASAQPPAEAPESFDPSWLVETGRTRPSADDGDDMVLQLHGELQLRLERRRDLALTPPPADSTATSLGQKTAILYWHRLRPRIDFAKGIFVEAQADLPRGLIAGDTTRYVGAAEVAQGERDALQVDPRWLYLHAMTPIGLVLAGQMGSHWGTGLLSNDGDHPRLFGDVRGGSISERVLFATRPGGEHHPLAVIVAGELVFKDAQADLRDGDHAWQGLLAVVYGDETNQAGVYGAIRRQSREETSTSEFTPYSENLDVQVFDVFGKFAAPIPGGGGYVFGEVEAAAIYGSTNYVRTPESAILGEDEKVRSWGGAATLGAARVAHDEGERWGDLVASVEWGYATGDADPNDGIQRRFNFDPNHQIGLLLFNHVLAWSTARSAVNASDPTLLNRGTPGLQFYPSNGSVFGATYVYPTVVVRPHPWLDLKAAMLVANTTADVVDPYEFGVNGVVRNHRGGDAKRHDLGLELDAGAEARVALGYDLTLQVGAEGGILFPGHAFDDAYGNGLARPWMAQGRFGLQY